MGFFNLSEAVNRFLYEKDLNRLTEEDYRSAVTFTRQLIKDVSPHWSEKDVDRYYDKLGEIRLVAIDEWSRRMGAEETL